MEKFLKLNPMDPLGWIDPRFGLILTHWCTIRQLDREMPKLNTPIEPEKLLKILYA